MPRLLTALVAILFCTALGGSSAAELAAPSGPTILTVSGAVGNTNADGAAQFDLAALEALPRSQIVTSTPWTSGVIAFEGVRLRDLLDAVAARGSHFQAVALNDYKVAVDAAQADEWGAIVAYRADGAPMTVRQKGPLWIIFPLDGMPADALTAARKAMVWQLTTIHVE